MLEIDASAGGQVLRNSLALSTLTKKAVKIKNIRANRPNPGLQQQHLTALQTAAKICNAKIEGAGKGSKEVVFEPGEIQDMQLNVNIGTAGSITLLLQSILIPSLIREIKLRIFGGTDVAWSPPFNYMNEVLLPTLTKTGARFDFDLITHGYYPKGNGSVSFKSFPAEFPLKPIIITKLGNLQHIKLFSHSASLPREVSLNQANRAKKELEKLGVDIEEKIESRESANTIGSNIDLIAFFDSGAIIAANALGAKGKPAVAVGKEAALKLLKEISSQKPVDSHLADQLIPFMAIAKGESKIQCSSLTEHTLNSIAVAEKILDLKFSVEGEKGESAEISVEGIGFN